MRLRAPGLDWTVLVGLLAVPVVAVLVLPHAPPCFSRSVLGLPCPGCGLGRSLAALVRLEPLAALRHYPPLLPLALGHAAATVWVVGRLLGRPMLSTACRRLVAGLAGCVAVLVVGNWIFRLLTGVY